MKEKSVWLKGKWWLIIILLPALGCVFICLYFTVIRYADQSICYGNIAKRTGVKPDWVSIAKYIEENVKDGMTEKEAIQALERIGPVQQKGRSSGQILDNGVIVRSFFVGGCFHYLNKFTIDLYFFDEKVVSDHVIDFE